MAIHHEADGRRRRCGLKHHHAHHPAAVNASSDESEIKEFPHASACAVRTKSTLPYSLKYKQKCLILDSEEIVPSEMRRRKLRNAQQRKGVSILDLAFFGSIVNAPYHSSA